MTAYRRRPRRKRWPLWVLIIVLGTGITIFWRRFQPSPSAEIRTEPSDLSTTTRVQAFWRWPVDLDSSIILGTGNAPRRIRFSTRQAMDVYPVADGSLLFAGFLTPIGGPQLAVLEHSNGVWTAYTFDSTVTDLAPLIADGGDTFVAATSPLARSGSLDFLMWDSIARQPMNPRYLLPNRSIDARPAPLELVFIQDEQAKAGSDPTLRRGPTTVALRGVPARLIDGPMRVAVMRGATRVGDVYRDAGTPTSGPQAVGDLSLPVGRTAFDLVSHGFDGSVVSRRIFVTATEPPTAAD